MIQHLQFVGELPPPRFGHTFTLVTQDVAVLYGGAVGSTDAFHCDLKQYLWTKMKPEGLNPGIRAAHAACAVQGQLIIYGGALKSGEFADHEIYLADLKRPRDRITWTIKKVIGMTPGQRYGHCIAYMKPFLIVFGGNVSGSESANDVWIFDIHTEGSHWLRLDVGEKKPRPRAYHSCSVCQTGKAKGMMVVFGGRLGEPNKSAPLKDTWGLRMHRLGNWDWVSAPYISTLSGPVSRYQHTTHFLLSLMVVIGGRQNESEESHMLDIYDTQTSEWHEYRCKDSQNLKRFRHASFINQQCLYIHGGFIQNQPTYPTDSFVKINLHEAFKTIPGIDRYFISQTRNVVTSHKPTAPYRPEEQIRGKTASSSQSIRICANVYETRTDPDDERKVIKKIPIQELTEQRKRLIDDAVEMLANPGGKQEDIFKYLLKPTFPISNSTSLISSLHNKDRLVGILDDAFVLMEKQPTLLKLRCPAKIFGDLYGQYQDLLNFFSNYGYPSDQPPNGDIESFDYLFLGNYVDFGLKSLELIFLLLVMKIQYPEQVHLLRGWHQNKKCNQQDGLFDLCNQFFGDKDPSDSTTIFFKLNKVFQMMPLAALLDDKILCVHRGIGNSYLKIDELNQIQRPLVIDTKPKTTSQTIALHTVMGQPREKAQEATDFDIVRIQKFMSENGLNYIIRGSDSVSGAETFIRSVISICSCMNVGGLRENQGAMLIIKKNCEIGIKSLKSNKSDREQRWITSRRRGH